MWKIQEVYVTQILREINFADGRSSKTSTFAILGVLNLVDFANFSLQKVQKFIIQSLTIC